MPPGIPVEEFVAPTLDNLSGSLGANPVQVALEDFIVRRDGERFLLLNGILVHCEPRSVLIVDEQSGIWERSRKEPREILSAYYRVVQSIVRSLGPPLVPAEADIMAMENRIWEPPIALRHGRYYFTQHVITGPAVDQLYSLACSARYALTPTPESVGPQYREHAHQMLSGIPSSVINSILKYTFRLRIGVRKQIPLELPVPLTWAARDVSLSLAGDEAIVALDGIESPFSIAIPESIDQMEMTTVTVFWKIERRQGQSTMVPFAAIRWKRVRHRPSRGRYERLAAKMGLDPQQLRAPIVRQITAWVLQQPPALFGIPAERWTLNTVTLVLLAAGLYPNRATAIRAVRSIVARQKN